MAKSGRVSRKQKRKEQRAAQQKAQRMQFVRYAIVGIIVIAALAAFGFYRASTAPQVDVPEEIMAANIDGPADAPVRIVEFGDFGCPACRAWHNNGIKEQLQEEFGEQISFTFRHFPVITAQSPQAAQAGQCASEQGDFWAYHDYIYERTIPAALSIGELISYSGAVGLDTAAFESCLESGKYKSYVDRDWAAASAAGARGTPSFYINGEPVSFSYDVMAGTIREILGS